MNSFFYNKCNNIASYTLQLDLILSVDTTAQESIKYISNIYSNIYKANITPNSDIFLSSKIKNSEKILACVGVTFSNPTKLLFSERYLTKNIEQIIFEQTAYLFKRDEIVEVGALASDNPHVASDLIRLIPVIIWFLGMKVILLTSTLRLRKLLKYHKIPFIILGDADPNCLSEQEKKCWGDYYNQQPQTCIILLNQCGHLFNSFCGNLTYSKFSNFKYDHQDVSNGLLA